MQQNFKDPIDDFIIHTKTESDLLQQLREFFEICRQHNLYLSTKKRSFYEKEVKWCGRIIDSPGYRKDPSNFQAMRNLKYPQTVDELCQFIHCCRWMSTNICNFHFLIMPLDQVLKEAYTHAERKNRH